MEIKVVSLEKKVIDSGEVNTANVTYHGVGLLRVLWTEKEIKPVNPKGNQHWIFIRRTDGEAPILWPPDAKCWCWGLEDFCFVKMECFSFCMMVTLCTQPVSRASSLGTGYRSKSWMWHACLFSHSVRDFPLLFLFLEHNMVNWLIAWVCYS